MEFQLEVLSREVPGFFHTLTNAISAAYNAAYAQMPPPMHRDQLCQRRFYGYILPTVDYEIRRAFDNASFRGIKVINAENANRSAPHLEIHTPWCIFVISKVRRHRDVPRKANYRQKYVDQMFIPEVFPDMEVYSDGCRPLYVVTHASASPDFELKHVGIGRLTATQEAWSFFCGIDALCSWDALSETVSKTVAPEVRQEIVEKSRRVQIKKA